MTSAYRRDHLTSVRNDEFERLAAEQRDDIVAIVAAFEAAYPTPASSSGEKTALRRALARFLIDSGKVTFPSADELVIPSLGDNVLTFEGEALVL